MLCRIWKAVAYSSSDMSFCSVRGTCGIIEIGVDYLFLVGLLVVMTTEKLLRMNVINILSSFFCSI